MSWYKVGEKPAVENRLQQRPALDRFMDKVNRSAPNGCWEWAGVINNEGYGYFYDDCSKITAHRWSYQRFKGPLEKGQVVCHRCDNRKCVHPDHLFSGSLSDNSQDMIRKGRMNRKCLTLSQVFEIREHARMGMKRKQIAAEMGISYAQVSHVITGRTWNRGSASRKVTHEKDR